VQSIENLHQFLKRDQVTEHGVHLIEKAATFHHPVGDDNFKHLIEVKYSISLGQASRGRPRKMQEIGKIIRIRGRYPFSLPAVACPVV